MKRLWTNLFCAGVVFTLGITVGTAAENSEKSPAVLSHVNAAKAVAYEPGNDLTTLFDTVCEPALDPKGPKEPNIQAKNNTQPPSGARSDWKIPPAKAFDNLYYLGSPYQSTWAVTTSAGIIIIDSGYDYSAKELITGGLTKLGLDPNQIKYVILTHIHSDRIWGTPYLQKTYPNAHVIASEADWEADAKTNDPPELKPKKDMVATDGMKLTLGDTTLTLYSTPGHTPGTTSIIIPLKDGKDKHVGAVWGGINADMGRNGVQYFPTLQDTFKTWIASAKKFQEITAKENADVYITLHPFYDKAIDKLHALKFRKPGDPTRS